jgi:hypothetical protein
MGYTHYYKQLRDFTEDEFTKISDDITRIAEHLEMLGIAIDFTADDEKLIQFNGGNVTSPIWLADEAANLVWPDESLDVIDWDRLDYTDNVEAGTWFAGTTLKQRKAPRERIWKDCPNGSYESLEIYREL